MLSPACLLLLALGTSAQDLIPPAAVAPGRGLTGVHVDTPGDGDVWVLAPGYKARFGADAVEFFPYLGPQAPRLFPVTFRLRGITRGAQELAWRADAPPRASAGRVTFDRGLVQEVWQLRDGEVEQTFVLADPAGSGDLVVQLDVQTDLTAEDVVDGLRWTHPTLGAVHYGDVTTLDAHGRRCRSAARWCEGGIELRVPAAFLAAAQGAVTVDPVVRAVTIDTGSDQCLNADVAYEPTTRQWLVAYAREFATTDSDIITRRFDADGTFREEIVVATGSRESRNPSVGANAVGRQFLIAWDEDTGIANRVILGRTRDAASAAQGATFTVLDTSGLGNDDFAPAVGGSIATDANGGTYAVFCLSDSSAGLSVSFVRVTTGGATSFRGIVSQGHDAQDVRALKARTTDDPWVCVYRRNNGGVSHVHMVDAPATGTVFRSIGIDSSGDCRLGGVAGRAPEYLVVHSRTVASGNSDIFCRSVQMTRTTILARALTNLTAIEPGAIPSRDQTSPSVAFDGCRFTYAYQEAVGAAGAYDLFAAVVSAPTLTFTDGHVALHAPSQQVERFPVIAATGEMGGPVARSFVVFDQIFSGNVDVNGVLFDGIRPGFGVSVVNTGCGSVQLSALDEPIMGITVRLRASRISTSAQLFTLGVPATPIPLCAAGCALGMNPIVATVLGTSLDLPIPCGATLVGAQLAVQNFLVGGSNGCQPPSTPVALEASPTLVLRVR